MNSQDLFNLSEAYLDVYSFDEERAPGVKPYRPNPTQAEVRADAKKAAERNAEKSAGKSGWNPDESKYKGTLSGKGGLPTPETSARMSKEAPYKNRMMGQMGREYGSRVAAQITRTIKGPGEPQAVTLPRMKSKPSKDIVRREQVDLYDIIISHLLDEGYADTPEAAEAIMVSMSEDWRDSICEEYKKLPVQKMTGQIVRKLKIHDPNYYKPGALTQAQKLINVMDTHSERKEKAKSKLNKNK